MRAVVLIRPAAGWDLEEAFDWSEGIESGLGPRFLANVDRIVTVLEEHPFAYQLHYKTVRRAVVQQSPYLLYHVSTPERVHIIACYSGHRDPRWIRRALRSRSGA